MAIISILQTRFHLVKKSTAEVISHNYEAPAMFFFHTSNAYEEEDCIVLDVAAYENDDGFPALLLENIRKSEKKETGFIPAPSGQMRRYVMPLNTEGKKVRNVTDISCK